jgi:hypothetical protein
MKDFAKIFGLIAVLGGVMFACKPTPPPPPPPPPVLEPFEVLTSTEWTRTVYYSADPIPYDDFKPFSNITLDFRSDRQCYSVEHTETYDTWVDEETHVIHYILPPYVIDEEYLFNYTFNNAATAQSGNIVNLGTFTINLETSELTLENETTQKTEVYKLVTP